MVNGTLNFWDNGIWSFVVVLAVIFGAMLLANTLRRKIKFIRRSLIPASVLAGFLVLGIGGAWKAVTGNPMLDTATLEALTYHGLGLGFVSLSLRTMEKTRGKQAKKDIFNTATVVVNTYLVQGIVGLTITIVLFYIFKSFAAAGMLLPMGFGQGPGQAYAWGKNFTALGFENGVSYGLSVAAMGFIMAGVGGVFYLRRIAKKKGIAAVENAEQVERLTAEQITAENEIPLSESVDKLTVQFALVFLSYGLSYLLMWTVHHFCSGIAFYDNTVCSLMWGFNFLVGTAVALCIKRVLLFLMKKGYMKRSYTNNFMLNRISGTMFDLMVTSSIAAINLEAFTHKEFVLSLVLISVIGAAVTYFYVKKVCEKLFADYTDEAFLSLYGMLTGTASTGIILLREIDPTFKTSASGNLVYQNLWAIIFGFPMLLLMGYVGKSMTAAFVTLAALAGLLLAMSCVMFRDGVKAKIAEKKAKKPSEQEK